MKQTYKHHNRKVSGRGGPGGLDCPCCNTYGCHPRYMKYLTRRRLRRITKQSLRRDLDNE